MKIKVGEDIQKLLSETYDYVSDAVTTLDSARDKIAFLNLDFSSDEVGKLCADTKNLLKNLQAQKRRLLYVLDQVQS